MRKTDLRQIEEGSQWEKLIKFSKTQSGPNYGCLYQGCHDT